jgi:hypothetical protein
LTTHSSFCSEVRVLEQTGRLFLLLRWVPASGQCSVKTLGYFIRSRARRFGVGVGFVVLFSTSSNDVRQSHGACNRLQDFNLSPAMSSWASLIRKLIHHIPSAAPRSSRNIHTYLYHHNVGPTVPRCHKLWASTIPRQGGKSRSSRLIASMTHMTIKPGQAAHILCSFRYRVMLNQVQRRF